jgi:hypothetical protein
MTIIIDPVLKTVSVNDGTVSASFSDTDRVASSQYEHRFEKSGTQTTDILQLYGNALAPAPTVSAPLTLESVSFLRWSHRDRGADVTTIHRGIFGTQTAVGSVPATGTANFLTTFAGERFDFGTAATATTAITGTATFAVDYGNRKVSSDLSLAGGTALFAGVGSYDGVLFNGTYASSRLVFRSGSFTGGFFGPAAGEFAYVLFIKEHNPDPYAGASVAPADMWYSGIVVGRKN